jgi:hypothetical protein
MFSFYVRYTALTVDALTTRLDLIHNRVYYRQNRSGRRQEKPSALKKRTYSPVIHENSLLFSVFVGHFCPFGSGSRFSFKMWIRIRIQPLKINADPCKSGSTTLVSEPGFIVFG